MELVDGVVGSSLLGLHSSTNSCIGQPIEQLRMTWVDVVLLTAKASALKQASYKAQGGEGETVKGIQTKRKTARDHARDKRDGSFSCYHGVLSFVSDIVRVGGESNAKHLKMPTQLRLFSKKSVAIWGLFWWLALAKMKVVLLSCKMSSRQSHRSGKNFPVLLLKTQNCVQKLVV